MNCRFCNYPLAKVFADIGMSPFANSYINRETLGKMEPFYPLRTFVCEKCLLVQLEEFETPQHIFSNYLYFSSYSQTWLKHVEEYANLTISQFGYDHNSQVIEVASNDGYLLQHFKKKGIPILGIEPAENIAKHAVQQGIPTLNKFFGKSIAEELVKDGKQADLLIAINVLPHVPNLNDFISGLKILLKPNGILTIQFSSYLLQLIEKNEFDTIYHEHFSYFSLHSIQKILAWHGLVIFNVEELSIHGGSLRIHVCHTSNNSMKVNESVSKLIEKEKKHGLTDITTYTRFQSQINSVKRDIWQFFIEAKKENKKIVGYGAPAKGNTLLNYCGIDRDLIEYTVDINPHKQGWYLPGTHIPIKSPEDVCKTKPDYLLILAWNLKEEVMEQMSHVNSWGGKFVVLIPEVKIYS